MNKKKILCIGKGRMIISPLVKKLQQAGYDATGTANIKEAEEKLSPNFYDIVAFGSAITEDTRRIVTANAARQNPAVISMVGLFPSIPLLVYQGNNVLYQHSPAPKAITNVTCNYAKQLQVRFTAQEDCHLTFVLLRVNWLFQTFEYNLTTQYFTTGPQSANFIDNVLTRRGRKFLLIQHYGHVVHLQQL
jgi:hypothetical protein